MTEFPFDKVLVAVAAHFMADVLLRDAELVSMSPAALRRLLDEVDALRDAVRAACDL